MTYHYGNGTSFNRTGWNFASPPVVASSPPIALPSFVEAQNNHGFTTTNTVPALEDAAAGDMLVAFCCQANATNGGVEAGLTPPEGWTLLDGKDDEQHVFYVYYMVADGPLAQTSWVWNANHWCNVGIVCYSGAGTPKNALFDQLTGTPAEAQAQALTDGEIMLIAGHTAEAGAGTFGDVGTLLCESKESADAFEVRSMGTDGSARNFTGGEFSNKIAVSLILPAAS